MTNLLNKTVQTFTIYALMVLAASIPAYYFLVDRIWLTELDEHNLIIAERTEIELNSLGLSNTQLSESLLLWNKIQPGTNLIKQSNAFNRPDSTYTLLKPKPLYDKKKGYDRFRVLLKTITINNQQYQLTVATNVEESEETVLALAMLTFIFFLLLVTGFLLLNKRLSVTLWQPFKNTLQKLQAFNLNGQTNIEFEKTTISEFEELNTALQKLIEHTVIVYQSQKEFTENASHELQTPLAIIKGKLDLLLQNEQVSNRQYEIVEEINKALTRVSRINANLLLLSKIINQQFVENEAINLSALTDLCINQINEHLYAKALSIETKIQPHITVKGNKVLVEILLNNLILNAIKHNYTEGEIRINLDKEEFTISNSGKEALQKQNLYKRFNKVSMETAGSGLGLAIVKQICDRHQWNVKYDFQHQLHSFSVHF